MSKLQKLLLATFTLFVSTASYAGWETGYRTGESDTGDWRYTRCYYETMHGYEFSIVVKGMCPYSVKINPETGQVQK